MENCRAQNDKKMKTVRKSALLPFRDDRLQESEKDVVFLPNDNPSVKGCERRVELRNARGLAPTFAAARSRDAFGVQCAGARQSPLELRHAASLLCISSK